MHNIKCNMRFENKLILCKYQDKYVQSALVTFCTFSIKVSIAHTPRGPAESSAPDSISRSGELTRFNGSFCVHSLFLCSSLTWPVANFTKRGETLAVATFSQTKLSDA